MKILLALFLNLSENFSFLLLGSKFATIPGRGVKNTIPKAILKPVSASVWSFAPLYFRLSPTQQQSPAIIPTSPASGPRVPPKTRGTIAAIAQIGNLLYGYVPSLFIFFIDFFEFS